MNEQPTSAADSGERAQRPLIGLRHAPSGEGAECCCNCRHHVADHSHPITDGDRIIKRRGWVCLAPEFDEVFSGWPFHGLCEMWAEDLAATASDTGGPKLGIGTPDSKFCGERWGSCGMNPGSPHVCALEPDKHGVEHVCDCGGLHQTGGPS